ncbi:MAG: precorrin-3B C(17)-methyltransferase [Cyanobacteriota bacterium]|nr:precorrin-3B C(17)-methyltransferase [Cyanobacteriota bacterium]
MTPSFPISVQPCWGLGFSPVAEGVLARLEQAGVVQAVAGSGTVPDASTTLSQQWTCSAGFVVVGATGLVTRLVAPLLQHKHRDPPVVVVDPEGRFAIPLVGGHVAGAEALSQRVAAVLGGIAVLTGASSGTARLALDAFGSAWGWRRGHGDWTGLMRLAAAAGPLGVVQESGHCLWRELEAARALSLAPPDGALPVSLVVSARLGPACRWHPPVLWIGLGCERGTSLELLDRLVDRALQGEGLAPLAVAGLATVSRKADEPALQALADQRHWPLRLFEPSALSTVAVPNPSAAVAAEMGTPSVAEASALLAAGHEARLIVPKQIEHRRPSERGAATVAIAEAFPQWAPQRGHLHLVGSGPGRLDLLTPEARDVLARCSVWVGYGLYLDLLEPLRRPDQLRLDGRLTQERERCRQALDLASQGLPVALVSSGDSGIYAMAGLALEMWLDQPADGRPGFTVHPGISALQLGAARAGAPLMHDFCAISLSDRLTPWPVIERRLQAAAAGDFVVALYNPRSEGRDWQLVRARELLLAGRDASTPVAICRQLGREQEQVGLHTLATLPIEQVDMLTLVLVGNSTSYVRSGRMVTPRGYPGATLS